MTYTTRTALILSLIFSLAASFASAQETTTTTPATTATAAAAPATTTSPEPESEQTAQDRARTRENIINLLRRHPRNLTRVVSVEPTLLLNDQFLAPYPDVAKFVTEHPEVRRNPHYYVGNLSIEDSRPRNSMDEAVESVTIMATFALIAFALAWLVRTVIDQKRWNRLSKQQTEVHNKILDRFGSSEELLAYIKTPAGTKYLESAPIALHAERPPQNAPVSRVLWSIQLGVIIAAGSIGMLFIGATIPGEGGNGLFAMGAIGLSIGAGFIASAFISLFLSRRLGMWEERGPSQENRLGDSGLVR
jgi:ABC-type Fe3+-siderophore transport system permease subunit